MSLVVTVGRSINSLYKAFWSLFGARQPALSFRPVYTPGPFAVADLAELDRLVARDAFVVLLSHSSQGELMISHVPILYRRDGEQILIEGHWARGNPQSRHATRALIIVRGAHSYISASWFLDKEENGQVPTWDYAVAHLHGELELVEDELGKASIVQRLSELFESSVGSDWVFEYEREDYRKQLKGIVGFRFVVTRVDMKFKLNQKDPVPIVEGLVKNLKKQPGGQQQEVASLMTEFLEKRKA